MLNKRTGSAATCCSSDVFKITSYRDGASWYMEFEKGIPKFPTCKKGELNGHPNGTYIYYKPSQEVFNSEPINFDFEEICGIIEEYSYFNKGITFNVTNGETKETRTFKSDNGLIDFEKKVVQKPIHATPIHITMSEDGMDIEIIAQWTKGKERFYLFSNGGENREGGTPITGIKSAITSFIKKQDDSIDGDNARIGLMYICSVNLESPSYRGQTKESITNPELKSLAQRAMGQALNDFAMKHSAELADILVYLKTYQKAEAAANEARETILNHTKEIKEASKSKIINTNKLRDARKLGPDSMLIINEGVSAGGSMSTGRQKAPNGDQIGILMLRGKAINALSNSINDVLANEEVKLFERAIGLTYGSPYDAKKLRYGKIAICADADFDGSHIGLLILAIIQRLFPDLIKEGRVYWLKAPVSKKQSGKKVTYFYSDEERINDKTPGIVQFYKGLGKLSDEDLAATLFNPKDQHLEQIEPDKTGIDDLVKLMGEDVEPRKNFITGIDFGGFTL